MVVLRDTKRGGEPYSRGKENQRRLNVFFQILHKVWMKEKGSRFTNSLDCSMILLGVSAAGLYDRVPEGGAVAFP